MKKLSIVTLLASCLAAPLHSQAAVEPKALLGKWVLTGMTLAGQSISCPGELPLPPGVPETVQKYAKCNAGEFIQLIKRKSRGIYFENITNIPTTSPNGSWTSVTEKRVAAAATLPEIPEVNYMIFDDSDNTGDPQAYDYVLSKDKKTLTISKSVGLQGPKFPVDLILTKQK